jgi:hypothetical protein
MKKYSWFILPTLLVAASPWACGGDSGNTGGGGSTTSTTKSTTTSSVVTTTSTTSGSSTDCTNILSPGDCATCLEGSCCMELAACNNDANCLGCATGQTDPATCDADPASKAALDAFNMCLQNSCNAQCVPPPAPPPDCAAPKDAASKGSCITIGGGTECNPVTNEGCMTGEACDFSTNGFTCYPPPNAGTLCGDCSNSAEPFCGGTLHCLEGGNGGKCGRFCCDAGDCGAGGVCNMDITGVPGLGICIVDADAGTTTSSSTSTTSSTSSGGTGGAGTTSSTTSTTSSTATGTGGAMP